MKASSLWIEIGGKWLQMNDKQKFEICFKISKRIHNVGEVLVIQVRKNCKCWNMFCDYSSLECHLCDSSLVTNLN
ncbi:unnamed protein product [Litomosoides sigmodontis]|uniref:Uncharacterized protein n=1 Tax=Litomosoides sigmodontis TaxID=42156 RepID=A0A3P6T4A0_LITSI|nr:unnamed protein product [Litomosoides sigmodontis]